MWVIRVTTPTARPKMVLRQVSVCWYFPPRLLEPSLHPNGAHRPHTVRLSYTHHVPQAAQQSQSIQTLLEAEKEAAKIVQQARQCLFSLNNTPSLVRLTMNLIASRSCTKTEGCPHRSVERDRRIQESERRRVQGFRSVGEPSMVSLEGDCVGSPTKASAFGV